ncbi:MAG: glycine cleavage system protein GcvH [Roseibacillus sp.]|nr:glycine cleavage system protein GcvH [Roseibacillus sp.]
MNIPEHLRYTSDHEWVNIEGDVATVGITDHAQEELSDVVFVELPSVGRAVGSGDEVGTVESVKAASPIYAPLGGVVVAINTEVEGDPSVINSSPYEEGWIFKVRLEDAEDLDDLLDSGGYEDLIS